jgi:hypothetical protein
MTVETDMTDIGCGPAVMESAAPYRRCRCASKPRDDKITLTGRFSSEADGLSPRKLRGDRKLRITLLIAAGLECVDVVSALVSASPPSRYVPPVGDCAKSNSNTNSTPGLFHFVF